MQVAHDIARKHIDKSAAYNKAHFDKRAKAVALEVGERVLVHNMRERKGKPKMRSYYEENIFRVIEARENVPVYKIQNVRNGRDTRVVHRNKLLKVDELPLDVFEDTEKKQKEKTRSQGRKKGEVSKPKDVVKEKEINHESDDSEDDDILLVENRHEVMLESELEQEVAMAEDAADGQVDTGDESEDSVESEPVEDITDADPDAEVTIPYDLDMEAGVEDEDELHSDVSDSDSPRFRRSSRTVIPRRVFTYPELGGDPVSEPQT